MKTEHLVPSQCFSLLLIALQVGCSGETDSTTQTVSPVQPGDSAQLGDPGDPAQLDDPNDSVQPGTPTKEEGECGEYRDESGIPVVFEVRNNRAETLYVGSRHSVCNFERSFSIENASGEVLVHESGSCYTCEALMPGGSGACAFACSTSPLYRLLPGSSLTLSWNGTVFDSRELPAQCADSVSPMGLSCSQENAAPAGMYRVKVTGSADYACQSDDADCASIDTDEYVYGGTQTHYGTGAEFEASAVFELGTANQTVTVTFEP